MVGGHDFKTTGHHIVKHGADCPSDNIDMFTLPETKKFDDIEHHEPSEAEEGVEHEADHHEDHHDHDYEDVEPHNL
jgi:hypothetical protein